MDSESITQATEAPDEEAKLLAGVFVLANGDITVSGVEGVDPGLLFIEAIKGIYMNLKKPKILRTDEKLPPIPPELAR